MTLLEFLPTCKNKPKSRNIKESQAWKTSLAASSSGHWHFIRYRSNNRKIILRITVQAMITAISDSDKIWWTVNQNLDAFSPEGISMALTVAGRNRVKYQYVSMLIQTFSHISQKNWYQLFEKNKWHDHLHQSYIQIPSYFRKANMSC